MTGVFSERVVNKILVIELVGINPISESINRSPNGFVVIDSHFIQMQSFIARNCWIGLLFINSSNIQIHNATISDNYNIGMIAQNSSNIYLSSAHIINNTMSYRIYRHKGYIIIINNTTSMCNKVGVYFEEMNTTQIVNTTASNNTYVGIQLLRTINIDISNTTVSHNVKYGLLMFSSDYVHIDGIIATNNALNQLCKQGLGGILIGKGYNIVINNTVSMYNRRGIVIDGCNKTQVVDTIASNNIHYGMRLVFTTNINISNITLSHNGAGLMSASPTKVHIDGIIAMNNSMHGICLCNAQWTYIYNSQQLRK